MALSIKSLKKRIVDINVGDKLVIAVFGLGGAGSYLSYELSQIVSLSNKKIEIILIDDDIVNEYSLSNEKFIVNDLHQNKAEVTQCRCTASFDVNMKIYDINIDSKDRILDLFKGKMGYTPILICNNLSESKMRYISNAMKSLSDYVVINSSVSEDIGEISLTYKNNGVFMTQNNLEKDLESYFTLLQSSKKANIECAKNIFLYIDDIICDKPVFIERTYLDTISKQAVSKYIDGEDICLKPLDKSKYIQPNIGDKILIMIVGLGGTGASVAYDVIHLASTLNKTIEVICIDGDIVETSNLNRQRFIMSDLNKNKAEVVGERCSLAYNMDIGVMDEYISCAEDIYDVLREMNDYYPIILGCSDSLKLRYLLCTTIKNMIDISDLPNDITYIDAGNDDSSGQIVCTCVENGVYLTPDFFDIFPNDLEDVSKAKLVTQMSCDELMVSAPQTKGANLSAASGIYSYLEDILLERKVYSFLTQFNNKNRKIISKKII